MQRFHPFLLLLLLFPWPLAAAEEPAGRITAVQGKVKLFRGGSVRGEAAAAGAPLHIGDVVRTAADGRAMLVLGDGDRVVLEADSALTLRARRLSHVDGGTVLFDIRKRTGVQGLRVTTATVTLGVKGTRFAVLNRDAQLGVYLQEGELEVTAGSGPLRYRADPLQAAAEALRRQMADDFRRTQDRLRAEFETAQEQMRQGKVEYVEQVLLRAGSYLQIEGNEAWDAPAPAWLDDKLAIFAADDFFR